MSEPAVAPNPTMEWQMISKDEKEKRLKNFRKKLKKEHIKAVFPHMTDDEAKHWLKRLKA